MIYQYVYVDSIKVGTIGYEIEPLKKSIRDTGGDHDTGEPRIVIYEFYNHTNSKSIAYTNHFALQGKFVEGVGKCLLALLVDVAKEKNHAHIYVVGAKRQAWDAYLQLGFQPLGTNVLNWCIKTSDLENRTRGVKAISQTKSEKSNAVRVETMQFRLALNSLAMISGHWSDDDPIDPRTQNGYVLHF